MRDYLIPEYNPDLLTIWITEPDHTQHDYGLASPEAEGALQELDGQLEGFLESLKRDYYGEDLTCFLLSDHGFSTVSEQVNPKKALIDVGLKESFDSGDIVQAPCSFYLGEGGKTAVNRLAVWEEFSV